MSNTDGIPYSNTDALDRILKQVCEEKYGLEQELASLREQLKEANEIIGVLPKEEIRMLNLTIKQQEEVIRELTSSLVYIVKTLGALTLPQDEPEALAYYEALKAIEKAKSLTTKDKWNQ